MIYLNSTSTKTFSSQIIINLLDEAQNIPIIFAFVSSTGFVLLEEYTDAEKSLNWENISKQPHNEIPLEMIKE